MLCKNIFKNPIDNTKIFLIDYLSVKETNMFKLTYKTDEGLVEAQFKTEKELLAFQASLRKRENDRIKRSIARKEAEEQKEKDAKEAELKDMARRQIEIREGFKEILLKAKNYGMTPERVVELITESLAELVDKPVLPVPEN